MNQAALELFGYDQNEIIQLNFGKFYVHPQDAKRFLKGMKQKKFVKNFETTLSNKDGTEMECLLTVTANQADEGRIIGFQGIIRDITEFKRIERALRESEKKFMGLSITDDLTKLYNLRHFYHQMASEMERSRRYHHLLSLLMLDIDDFKKYNDTHGHLEGNDVLVKLGMVIRESLRQTDTAYRYGGEEFMVIAPETGGDESFYVAERIRNRFEGEIFRPGANKMVHMTVSIGVSQYKTEEEMESFIKRVDQAMYMAKNKGKNRVVYLHS